ncbi:hypothetical protein F5Y16DRAFT_338240 [Xylariaceae sp. FL0255]|nr:hypothetical protein F5Y16DRAFT_338240 [Xylariaceae sp. FL0255]
MHFSTATLLAALMGMTCAQTVHVVSVSSPSGALAFSPNSITAAVGDMVQYQFQAGNHSVVQSNFDNPCEPIQFNNASAVGFFSGYMDVAAGSSTGNVPVYTIMINATTPMWVYCSQAKHCQAGMSMVINEDTTANATRSLANYQSASKAVAQSLDPLSAGTATSSGGSSSGGSSSSGTTSGTGSTSTTPVSTALGSVVVVSAWTGLLSVAAAFVLL